jgi:hypothetical protein
MPFAAHSAHSQRTSSAVIGEASRQTASWPV